MVAAMAMNPIVVMQIITGAIAAASSLWHLGTAVARDLMSFLEARKMKLQEQDPVKFVVEGQDKQAMELEECFTKFAADCANGAVDPRSPAAQQQITQVVEAMNTRRAELVAQLGRAMQERAQWEKAAKAGLVHLTEPLDELLQRRIQARSAFRFWPEVDPGTTRYVVVMGPAGVGKSTFIKQQLSDHGYADLASKVDVCSEGAGTKLPTPYFMNRHNVLLLDSVGDAGGGTALLQGEALAADVLVVFLGQGIRGERIHGDAAALAYRMRQHMKTIFVVSKTDMILLERDAEEATPSGVEAYLQTLKKKAAAELQRMLVGCEGSVQARTKSNLSKLAGDTSSILRKADKSPEEWCDYIKEADWLNFVCYCRAAAIEGAGRSSRLVPAEAEAMQKELRELEKPLYGASHVYVNSAGATM